VCSTRLVRGGGCVLSGMELCRVLILGLDLHICWLEFLSALWRWLDLIYTVVICSSPFPLQIRL
ncbi:hypothetical protein A2U01_0057872, partial [Trifolium medium]|nr:hypothetical protein [Trifolium medium]